MGASFYGFSPRVEGVTAGGTLPVNTVTTVTLKQFFSAVAASNNLQTLYDIIEEDKNSTSWISFWTASTVTKGDSLYNLVQNTYGFSDGAMDALLTLANTLER